MYRDIPNFLGRQVWANSADPDQTAPLAPRGAVWSESTLFANPSAFFFTKYSVVIKMMQF